VTSSNFSDAALVLLGHDTALNPDSADPVYQHAAELRRRKLFAHVREAFWKQEPQVQQVLAGLDGPSLVGTRSTASPSLQPNWDAVERVPTGSAPKRVFIVPLLLSEGHFSEYIIPKALGFAAEGPGFARVQRRGAQTWLYCKPVGTHESMTGVLLNRAREVVAQFPFPRAPRPADVTLFLAGHGTGENEHSRKVIEQQAERIRSLNLYAAVHPVFLDEDPRIGECYRLAQTRNIVVVPFFITEGLHVREDIPVLMGEPERLVRQRLERGQPTWRNPTEKNSRLVWYARSVGTDPLMADVTLERVRQAASASAPG
jgi:sirohydrochlorin cobaltochelatase